MGNQRGYEINPKVEKKGQVGGTVSISLTQGCKRFGIGKRKTAGRELHGEKTCNRPG